jgi:PAS domain S-box-containing protein
VAVAIVCVLANVTSTLMINVLWRYREAFMSEQELSASLRLASEILESISESFILVDRAYRLLYLNRSACVALGVERADAQGNLLAQLGVSLASPAIAIALEAAWSGDGPRRFEIETSGRWYEFRSTPRANDMAVLFQDITDQRATQEALRAGERRLVEQAEVLDKATDAISIREIDGPIIYWNQSAARMFGRNASEVVGRPAHEVLGLDKALWEEATARVLELGEWRREVKLPGPDGRPLVLDSHLTLVRDEAGRPKSILTINTDITARVAMEERLRQTERLEAVGQLTGGVAHDFNNLLTVILGAAEALSEELADRTELQALGETIGRAAARGAALTHQLLAFAQRQALDPRPIDPQALLSETSVLLRRTLRADIAIVVGDASSVWPVLVDPAQLESALLNLCLNARDAMPQGGTLTIEAANVALDQDDADHAGVTPGDYVRITVTDDGSGISPENLPRVFDPFFTTKAFGKGTGLGLSMVYGFIKQSQGHIAIYSEVGHGASVKMYLPRAFDPAAPPDDRGPKPLEARGSEVVLVVEDDDMLRANVERQLTGLGYRVIASANGREALDMIRSGLSIDLLFTDVIMPGGLDGPALARAARECLPTLRVLYTSGYTENAIIHQGRLDPGTQLLAKPYVRSDLARKVRAVLEAPL